MLKLLTCGFSNKNVAVNVDRRLVPSIIRNNGELTRQSFLGVTTHDIKINLMKLITATATVQTRRIRPTWFNKLFEKSDLLDFIKECDDFCIIKHPDADKQIRISEDLGVGLSVLVTDHYYKIDWTTVNKIPRRRKSELDISCMSLSNESIKIEAKGSTSEGGRTRQRNHAQDQKRGPTPAQISVASCALLKENTISNIDYLDPPIISPADAKYKKSLLKADHYARVFNLIGQAELSKYFNYMRKRIVHDRNFDQFDKKQDLYEKIKTQYVQIPVRDRMYFGNIENYDDESLIFVGIDGRLLNVFSFIEFESQEDNHVKIGDDEFYLFADGVCIAFLRSLRLVEGQMKFEIPHHYDSFSIIDFDYSRGDTLIEYLSHIIQKVGGKVQNEPQWDRRYDLIVSFNDKRFAIEVKRCISAKKIKNMLAVLSRRLPTDSLKLVLLTNTRLSPDIRELILSRNIIVIDRTALDKIIENNKTILDYLR